MGSLYRNDLNKYKKYFKESAKLLGVDVDYKYIIRRQSEEQSGESIYSELSEPIKCSVIIEQGLPEVETLKQLNWFLDDNLEQILVDFPFDTPNLQEGCRFTLKSNNPNQAEVEYVIIKLSNTLLYSTCIVCLCQPILNSETKYNIVDKNLQYPQQSIYSDEENYSFINEESKTTMF